MFENNLQGIPDVMGLIENTLKTNWNYPAFTDYGTDLTFTFADVAKEIKRLHAYFKENGIEPGDRVAVCDRNSAGWAVTFLAAFTYGAVAVPILHDFHGEQILNVLVHSETKLMFCNNQVVERMKQSSEEPIPCEIVDIRSIKPGMLKGDMKPEDVKYFRPDPDGLAVLSYTSGSTGRSKGRDDSLSLGMVERIVR